MSGLEVARRGQAPVGEDHHVIAEVLEPGRRLGLPRLEDRRAVVGRGEGDLAIGQPLAVADPGARSPLRPHDRLTGRASDGGTAAPAG